MPDKDTYVGVAHPAMRGEPPDGSAEWTKLRCLVCHREGYTATASLPLQVPGGKEPVRDDDGVRLAVCQHCVGKENRAARRRRR